MGTVTANNTRISTVNSTTDGGTISSIGGGAGAGTEGDFFYQGGNSVSRKITSSTGAGFAFEATSTTDISSGSGTYQTLLIKVIFTTKDDLQNIGATNPGLRIRLGSASTAYYEYNVAGADAYPIKGGWLILPIDPNIAGYRDATQGSPSLTAADYFGVVGAVVTGGAKSENLAMDAVDVGNGLTVTGTSSIWQDFIDFDEGNSTNRQGYVSTLEGIMYVLGTLTIGSSTATTFNDSDETLVFPDGRFAAGWAGLAVDLQNASTDVDWTSCTFIGRGNTTTTDTRPIFTATSTSGAFDATSCTFTEFEGFTLTSACTFTSCVFNNCESISLNSGNLDTCTFNKHPTASNASLITATAGTLSNITDCTFDNTSGTGHAIDLGTVSTTQTINWNNFDTGYASTDGSTGNETIRVSVASGQTLTINVNSGYSTPTVYNTGLGTVSVVSGQVTLTVTVKDISTGSVIQNARVYVTAAAGGPLTEGTAIIDKVLTDVNGQVSDTRSYASNQPITGTVRKASSSPFYVSGVISGTVSSASGLDLTINLIRDE